MNIWRLKNAGPRRASIAMMCGLTITTGLFAAAAAPSLEFLEFLADSVQMEQEVLDPLSMQEMQDIDSQKDDVPDAPVIRKGKNQHE